MNKGWWWWWGPRMQSWYNDLTPELGLPGLQQCSPSTPLVSGCFSYYCFSSNLYPTDIYEAPTLCHVGSMLPSLSPLLSTYCLIPRPVHPLQVSVPWYGPYRAQCTCSLLPGTSTHLSNWSTCPRMIGKCLTPFLLQLSPFYHGNWNKNMWPRHLLWRSKELPHVKMLRTVAWHDGRVQEMFLIPVGDSAFLKGKTSISFYFITPMGNSILPSIPLGTQWIFE